MTAADLKTSDEWLREPLYDGLTVVDPDGWDRSDFERSWSERIDEAEFQRRLFRSTVLADSSARIRAQREQT